TDPVLGGSNTHSSSHPSHDLPHGLKCPIPHGAGTTERHKNRVFEEGCVGYTDNNSQDTGRFELDSGGRPPTTQSGIAKRTNSITARKEDDAGALQDLKDRTVFGRLSSCVSYDGADTKIRHPTHTGPVLRAREGFH
ncbi:hypothetical protein A4X03_0g8984, partial [Tilletia caries]